MLCKLKMPSSFRFQISGTKQYIAIARAVTEAPGSVIHVFLFKCTLTVLYTYMYQNWWSRVSNTSSIPAPKRFSEKAAGVHGEYSDSRFPTFSSQLRFLHTERKWSQIDVFEPCKILCSLMYYYLRLQATRCAYKYAQQGFIFWDICTIYVLNI